MDVNIILVLLLLIKHFKHEILVYYDSTLHCTICK